MEARIVAAVLAVASAILYKFRVPFARTLYFFLYTALSFGIRTGLKKVDTSNWFKVDGSSKTLASMSPTLISFVSVLKALNSFSDLKDATFEASKENMDVFYTFRMGAPWYDSWPKVELTTEFGGTKCYWVESPNRSGASKRKEDNNVIVYLHGGAYVSGNFAAYAAFCGELSRRCDCLVLFIEYGLMPHTSIPTQRSQIFTAYQLLARKMAGGRGKIAVAGDSAGGGHTLALLQKIVSTNTPIPAGGALMSAWADLQLESTSIKTFEDPLFPVDGALRAISNRALRDTGISSITDPELSCLFGSYSKLPPLYICAGSTEKLFDDSKTIAEKALQAGVEVEHEWHPLGVHVYPIFGYAMDIPEYKASLSRMCRTITEKFFK